MTRYPQNETYRSLTLEVVVEDSRVDLTICMDNTWSPISISIFFSVSPQLSDKSLVQTLKNISCVSHTS